MVDNVDEFRPLGEIVSNIDVRAWRSPGEVSSAFLNSTALVRGLLGPLGSGKTTTALVSGIESAIRAPRCTDGVRRWRMLAIRDNYRQLYKTLIPSHHDLFKPADGYWSGGQDRPAEHKLKFVDDFGPVEYEIQFAAIPEGSIRDWLDGYQPSSIFINAASSIPRDVFTYGMGRIGRFPAQRLLPPGYATDKHIIFDSNKTDVEHYLYDMCVANPTPDIDVYDMPGGLDPAAENLGNLHPTYYQDMARANAHQAWWVDINVHNRWGPSRSGMPVYPAFDDKLHVARDELEADKNLELCIGLDAGTVTGGRPAAVFFQVPSGPRFRVLDELYLDRCGPARFFDALLDALDRPWLRPASRRLRIWCDPSAFLGADKDSGELTWVEIGEKALGQAILAPESNELHAFRIPTVDYLLTQMVGPQDPLFRLSPRCKLLRAGFNSGYRYKRTEKAEGTTEKPDPEKNDYSHPHDALQHGATGYFGKTLLMSGVRSLRDPGPRGALRSPFSFDFKI